jgi:hypothetical protein
MSEVRKEKFAKVWNPISDAIVKEVNSECMFHPAHLTMSRDIVLDHRFSTIDNKFNGIDTDGIYNRLVKTRIDIDNLILQLRSFKDVRIRNLNDYRSFDIIFTFGNIHEYNYSNSSIYILTIKNGCLMQIKEISQYGDSRGRIMEILGHNDTVFSMLSLRLINLNDE